MDINEYQELAQQFAKYPRMQSMTYPVMGLAAEAGEVANVYKRLLRDDPVTTAEMKANMRKELGDVLWYLAMVAQDFGFSLGDIAKENLEKLEDRQQRGVLKGSGDDR